MQIAVCNEMGDRFTNTLIETVKHNKSCSVLIAWEKEYGII